MKRKANVRETGVAKLRKVMDQAMGGSTMPLIRQPAFRRNFTRPDPEEPKNIDVTNAAPFNLSALGAITLLNGVIQGTSATTRLGRKIVMKSLFIRSTGSPAATTAGSSPLRVQIVYDKQTNGALPAAVTVNAADSITSPLNLNNNERFRVVYDKTWQFQIANQNTWSFKKWIRLNLPVTFNAGNAGDVTDIQTGSLVMLVYQNNGITVAAPTTSIITRIRYTD